MRVCPPPMERMEVEPSAGGGALRRSNSAPQLPGTPPLEPEQGAARSRRSSECLESRGGAAASPLGRPLPLPPQGTGGSPSPRRRRRAAEEGMETPLKAWGAPGSRMPVSASSWTPSVPETLKRKGGVNIDPPPRKLFVAAVPITPPAP